MLPTTPTDDCGDCVPSYLTNATRINTKAVLSTAPFVATFAVLTLVAYRKVYPLISPTPHQQNVSKGLPKPATANTGPQAEIIARRIAALTFSSTIALSAVLTELLLCEISNSFNPSARSIALQITVVSLLGLLVVAIPLLGISSVVSKSGYKFLGEKRSRVRLAWTLELLGYAAFLVGFWTIGVLLPSPEVTTEGSAGQLNLFQACLDRLGITGVSLMALLSGFASVSAIWQNFGPKPKLVHESDITRKQAGLDATVDMIAEKKERLRLLERKMSTGPGQSFWTKTFRGSTDSQEKQTLEMEISGLETMSTSLESSISVLRSRQANQIRSTTALGRLSIVFSYTFSIYCVYRICTTFYNIARRVSGIDNGQNSDTDPVTYTIALFARNVYPSLDQASWAQQISFLLSGAMLLASFTAVTQTFHLFSRFMPSFLQATRTNFALLISQVSGMYVISSALMLRGMMPKQVGSVINSALGAGLLDPSWVQKWFEGFFMLAVVTTAVGIFIGRQAGSMGSWDDDLGLDHDAELGKRS